MENESKPNPYPQNITNQLFYIYISAILIWIFLCILLKLYNNIIGLFFIFVPIILYTISIFNLKYKTSNTETDESAQTVVLGLFALIPILTWTHDKSLPHANDVLINVLLAMVIGLVALYPFWIPTNDMIIIQHIRSIFQVISITLLSYGLSLLIYDVYNTKSK
jgi:hypothetical protein